MDVMTVPSCNVMLQGKKNSVRLGIRNGADLRSNGQREAGLNIACCDPTDIIETCYVTFLGKEYVKG